jgi:hypothetical protein
MKSYEKKNRDKIRAKNGKIKDDNKPNQKGEDNKIVSKKRKGAEKLD